MGDGLMDEMPGNWQEPTSYDPNVTIHVKPERKTWRMMTINMPWKELCQIYGFWKALYGTDIFYNQVPLLKTYVLVLFVLLVLARSC